MHETFEQRIQRGIVLGDGGYLIELERRGHVDSGSERVAAGLSSQSWNDFLRLSGWTQTRPTNMTGWSISGNGEWYYRSSSVFSPEFIDRGFPNPMEDFTETAELYFDAKLRGQSPFVENPAMAAKFRAVENLLASLV